MVKLNIYIVVFLVITIGFVSCTNSYDKKQNNESKNNITSIKNRKQGTNLYLIKQISKSNLKASDTTASENEYSIKKIEKISERVDTEFYKIVTKNHTLENHVEFSVLMSKNKTAFSKITSPWILTIFFDNDIFNNTDYYYTNGVNFELITPFADNSPVKKILPGAGRNSINFSGFSIQQNIYTPINPDAVEIQFNDRPFSAFLTISQFRESVNFQKKINLKSEISFGIVGPASMGETVQSSIHDIQPVGWQNQVKNDFVLNYSLEIEKGLISEQNIEINATASGNIGTLFNKAGAGFYLRTGSFLPVYRGSMAAISDKKSRQPMQYWFFIRGNVNAVLYDATLQGGLFNNQNPYTIGQEMMNRIVYGGSVGVAFYYNQVGIEFENFYLSPEFDGGHHFMYGRIKLSTTF
jgi:hypothetical protein